MFPPIPRWASLIAKGMKHRLKEEVWQCAGTITNANNHCKFQTKKKRDLVGHIQQEHLAEKVGKSSHIFKGKVYQNIATGETSPAIAPNVPFHSFGS